MGNWRDFVKMSHRERAGAIVVIVTIVAASVALAGMRRCDHPSQPVLTTEQIDAFRAATDSNHVRPKPRKNTKKSFPSDSTKTRSKKGRKAAKGKSKTPPSAVRDPLKDVVPEHKN